MASPAVRSNDVLRALLPVFGLLAVCAGIYAYRPNAMSYVGFNLLLTYAVPVALAACAQMFIIAAGDIDLSIGSFISLITCIGAVIAPQYPLLGTIILVLLIPLYGAIGAMIHARRLPSIVVTLGFSFIWLGVAVLILPRPGGSAPAWLAAAVRTKTPIAPLPVWILITVAIAGHLVLQRWSFGTVLRGVGGNPKAVARAGWSVLKAKATLYGLAGLCGVLSGLALTGIATSGDANIAPNYIAERRRGYFGRRRVRWRQRIAGRHGLGSRDARPDELAPHLHERSIGLAAGRARVDPHRGAGDPRRHGGL